MLIRKQVFNGDEVEFPDHVEGVTVENCKFNGGAAGTFCRTPETRLTIARSVMRDCTLNGTSIGPVIFKDCVVEGLRTTDIIWIAGATFSRCVLSGRMGSFIFFEEARITEPRNSPINKSIRAHNETFIKACDWCLDISTAEFDELDLRSLPAQKVIVNNHTQVKLNFEAVDSALRAGLFKDPDHEALIEAYVEHGEESRYDMVLATCKRSRFYRERMGLIEFLAKNGLLLDA